MFSLVLQIFKMNFLSVNFVDIHETFWSHRFLHSFLLTLFPHTSTLLFDLQVPIPLPHLSVLSLLLHCNPLSSTSTACLGTGVELSIRKQLSSSDCITEDKTSSLLAVLLYHWLPQVGPDLWTSLASTTQRLLAQPCVAFIQATMTV